MESNVRFFRRRANEELAAASRAVTDAARERRTQLARAFLDKVQELEAQSMRREHEFIAAERSRQRSLENV